VIIGGGGGEGGGGGGLPNMFRSKTGFAVIRRRLSPEYLEI
jgi:hypothetical protein